jgi:hypothetical protein
LRHLSDEINDLLGDARFFFRDLKRQ